MGISEPSKILEKFRDKRIDTRSALEQLLALIENSSSFKIRLNCIKILSEIWKLNEKTAPLSENIFNVLENLLISDSNEIIRNAAAFFLSSNFNDKAYKPMKWAIHNDDSQLVLETILNSLIKFLCT
ncbi:MAG: HEAT repeat domain-containing protein, partial [Promethearchaeota archaeon]